MRTLTLVLMTLGLAVAVAPADDEGADRQKLNDAFTKMLEGNKKAAKERPEVQGPGGGPVIDAVTTIGNAPTGRNVKIAVKVWAQLYEPKPNLGRKAEYQEDFRETDRYVSLDRVWQVDEAYRLWFQPAASVKVALYNVKDGERVEPPLLPDPDYAVSGDAIPMGKAFRMPITLTTEADKNETLEMVFAVNGDPRLPKGPAKNKMQFGVLAGALRAVGQKAQKDGALFRGLGLLANKPPRLSSQNSDDVATVVTLSDEQNGILSIKFRK